MTSHKEKYRSTKRDKPRIVYPPISHLSEKKDLEPDTEDLTYQASGSSFFDIFHNSIEKNSHYIENNFGDVIIRINETFNCQYELASQYFWLIHSFLGVRISPVNDVIVPCFHKSLVSLSTAFHLTKNGLWGPARPLIRHAFESLIIAKFCSVHNESEVFDKWVDGVDLYLSNAVFKKIISPHTGQFSHFWGLMSNYSHASVYASQPGLNSDDFINEINFNFVFIEMMLECKYHLLISHIITGNMRYYHDRYKDTDRTAELKKILNKNYSESKKGMQNGAKALIKNYRQKWQVQV